MLTIRQEQVDAFQQGSLRHFEDEMVAHVTRFSPRHCAAIGDTCVRRVVRLGIERSRLYGFSVCGPVRFYIELMFKFGSYFDTDPQYEWAREVLTSVHACDQLSKADWLFDRVARYDAEVLGQQKEYLLAALGRLRAASIDQITNADARLDAAATRHFRLVYPEKYGFLSKSEISEFIRHSFQIANTCGLSTPSGRVLSLGLACFAGHSFHSDDLYPWIGKTLRGSAQLTEEDRVRAVHTKALIYLNRALEERPES